MTQNAKKKFNKKIIRDLNDEKIIQATFENETEIVNDATSLVSVLKTKSSALHCKPPAKASKQIFKLI